MTIEDLPESSRCPDCGTWLPRAAIECPSCGRPRDVAMSGPPGRRPPSRRLLLGGGGAVVVAAALIVWALGRSSEPLPSTTPQPSFASASLASSAPPTPSPTPMSATILQSIETPTAVPSLGASPTPLLKAQLRAPLILPISIPDVGPRAKVTAAALKVRSYAGVANNVELILARGSELLLINGPIATDGYDWYEVFFRTLPGDPGFAPMVAIGWVAAGQTGHPPTFVSIGPPRCPVVPVTVGLLGSMTDLSRALCVGTGSFELHGMVETCYEGPETAYSYEPAWLGFSCYDVVELGTSVAVEMHFPPSVPAPSGLALGDLVRLVAHVNDPAAAGCRVVVPAGQAPGSVEVDQQVFVQSCRSALVIEEIEVTGHIDQPNPFGF